MTLQDFCLSAQDDLYQRLLSDPFFSVIPVLSVDPGLASKDIEQKLATLTVKGGTRGLGVLVLPVDVGDDEYPNVPDGPMMWKLAIQVVEHRLYPEAIRKITG
jgi:hypothetical protein